MLGLFIAFAAGAGATVIFKPFAAFAAKQVKSVSAWWDRQGSDT